MNFALLAIVVAAVAHVLSKRFLPAVLVSAVVSAVLFQVLVSINLGHLDPFFIIAFVTTTALAIPISAAVGAVVLMVRRANSS